MPHSFSLYSEYWYDIAATKCRNPLEQDAIAFKQIERDPRPQGFWTSGHRSGRIETNELTCSNNHDALGNYRDVFLRCNRSLAIAFRKFGRDLGSHGFLNVMTSQGTNGAMEFTYSKHGSHMLEKYHILDNYWNFLFEIMKSKLF